jgi:hypothetical protein
MTANGRASAILVALAAAGLAAVARPPAASAHGPIDPIASNYLARVGHTPPGLEAKVLDGDQRMWLRVPPATTVLVRDYQGAPYLRFSAAGVAVNLNSAMYYLNQTPVPLSAPANLTPSTPPHWDPVSGADSYSWHDGRLHALATVAIAPGATFVGHWRIPITVNGTAAAITGGLWHAAAPSIVWFWPILVLLACVLAAWRLHRPGLDRQVARGLGIAALIATAVAVTGRDLHGRPGVSVFALIELALVLAFVLWSLHRVLFGQPGYFTYLVVAVLALWQGAELIPTLLDGFVLAAEPAFLARAAAVLCLGTGLSLIVMVFRLAEVRDHSAARRPEGEVEAQGDGAWELA